MTALTKASLFRSSPESEKSLLSLRTRVQYSFLVVLSIGYVKSETALLHSLLGLRQAPEVGVQISLALSGRTSFTLTRATRLLERHRQRCPAIQPHSVQWDTTNPLIGCVAGFSPCCPSKQNDGSV
ncbi:hypothetical protein CEXT_356191 [Caerostris extrusa]|uniref:Uncharacterized protein n=1 Tax=Caerostris extrusa TaxID=172846 RepID=A0AAV4M9X7_CAEEX|nr:hypothetical protein CEXT_356191 [Caerostris extrusa]